MQGRFTACETLARRRVGVLGASERAERGADLRRGRKGAFFKCDCGADERKARQAPTPQWSVPRKSAYAQHCRSNA